MTQLKRHYKISYFHHKISKRKKIRLYKSVILYSFGIAIVLSAIYQAKIYGITLPPSLLTTNFSVIRAEVPTPTEAIQSNQLEMVIQQSLDGTQGTYGVAVKNLTTKEAFFYNANRQFDSGSLYKLWVMATVYQQLEEGKLTQDQVLSQDIATLNRKFFIDPEAAELKEGRITLTVKQALEQMITISHNYAALLLSEKIKLSTVEKFLTSHQFTRSSLGTNNSAPITTASEMASFWETLYQGSLGNPESTQQMLDLLKKQRLNNKLPKYLPGGVPMAHKTGELGWFTHDAGIVFSPSEDYIIVVLSESESPKGAEERIGQVSKAVYDYFTKE